MAQKDYSMFIYYKGHENYPNAKAAFFGFYEKSFDVNYKGKPEDKEEAFKDFMSDLLYQQASEIYTFPNQIGTKSDCYSKYLKDYFYPEINLKKYEK